MSDDEPEEIEILPVDEELDDPAAMKMAVRRILVSDEARIMSVVSVALIAVGTVFSLAWLFLAWRVERNASVAAAFGGGGGSSADADVIDRIVALVQISGVLIVPLLLVAAGCALRLYASRIFTLREA